jgi:hypothetical protein
MTSGPYWIACRWSRWPNLPLAFRAEGLSSQEKLLLWRWVVRDARGMAHRSPLEIPGDLRARLEVARLDLLALFRALDRMDLSPEEIPQRLLRQLFESDADYAEALWALNQVEGSLDRRAMLRATLTALDRLPSACAQFRKQLPARAHPTLEQLEGSVRKALSPKEAYNMVPGRDPENV